MSQSGKRAVLVTALLWAWATLASAQQYPTKPIRMIIPSTPGGGIDAVGRIIAPKLAEALGQPVLPDNRAGAATMLGSELLAKSPPDGHTILMVTNSHAITASLYEKLNYDPIKDFSAVTQVTVAPYVLVIHPSVPANSVKELIALAMSKPGQLNFSSAGTGTSTHLSGELFKYTAQVNILHVPYKGVGAVTDLVAGRVQIMFNVLVSSMPFIKANRLRALATTGPVRSRLLPDIPTVSEAGLKGYESVAWYGVLVPAHTPTSIVNTLNQELVKILKTNDVRDKLMADGADVIGNSPDEFSAYMKSDIARWAKLISALGLRAED